MNTRGAKKKTVVGSKRKKTTQDDESQAGNSGDIARETQEEEVISTQRDTRTIARVKFDRAVNMAFSSVHEINVTVYLSLLEEAWKAMSLEEVEELLDTYIEAKSAYVEKQKQVEMKNNPSLARQLAEIQGYEKLPEFSGEFQDWISFRDAFVLEVGGSEILEPKQKLRRLLGCLTGRAKRVVGNWEFTDENYDLAWLALINEFENPDLALNGHLDTFYNLKQCRPNDVESLKELLDVAKGKQRDIMNMNGMSGEKLGDILWRKEVERRLDEATRVAWYMSAKREEIATCDELYNFLAKRSRAIDTAKPSGSKAYLPTKSISDCLYCLSTSHTLFRCNQFLTLSVENRRKESQKMGCCFGCLKKGHNITTCYAQACPNCQPQKHHQHLCFKKSQQ